MVGQMMDREKVENFFSDSIQLLYIFGIFVSRFRFLKRIYENYSIGFVYRPLCLV